MSVECREVRQLAEAFVSEQLLVETTRAIVAHLEQCPTCRAEIEGLRRVRASTRSAFNAASELQARPEFVARLSSQLQATGAAPRTLVAPRARWLALAAGLMLVAGSALGLRIWAASDVAGLLRSAVGDHRFCALDFKLAERPIPLAEAALRYGVVNRALESVPPSTSPLPGGTLVVVDRHSCVFQGRRFTHIVMRYKDQTVSLLVAADGRSGPSLWAAGPPSDGTTSRVTDIDGIRVTAFHQSRHSAFVVSSLGADDLREVAQAMVGPVSRALAGA